MNTYFINGLHITAYIGTKSWQKAVPQKILVDIALQSEIIPSDNQNQNSLSFDYENFSQQIINKMSTPHWDSLEIFGNQLSQHIQTTMQINWLKITISIPHGLANMQVLGLVIEQGEKHALHN